MVKIGDATDISSILFNLIPGLASLHSPLSLEVYSKELNTASEYSMYSIPSVLVRTAEDHLVMLEIPRYGSLGIHDRYT